jgi:hypothetical protein
MYAVGPADRAAFKRCRREWDFGSLRRCGLEPVRPGPPPDLGRAVRDALAVYYFPGMWEWDRAIVRPLAHDRLDRSVRGRGAPDEEALADRGHDVLTRYFDWAPLVDAFTPVRVETDFDVNIADPGEPGRALATAAGEPVHYQDRVDLLAVDRDDNYWVVDHRVVTDRWAELDELLLEERATSACWAWELFFMGMRVAGVVYNELWAGPGPPPDQAGGTGERAAREPTGPDAGRHRRRDVAGGRPPAGVSRDAGDLFRRTRVPRAPDELARSHAQLAAEAREMVDDGVRVYPNPTPANCGRCDYREPCVATSRAEPVEPVLAASYRRRPGPVLEEGRLGGATWAMGRGAAPPKFRSDKKEEDR